MTTAGDNSKKALITALNGALADHLALYVKAKNFHWHVSGPRFRDLHLLFDEQAQQINDLVDIIGERVRKNAAGTITPIGAIASQTRISDQDDATLGPDAMVAELRDDNLKLLEQLREVKQTSEEAGDFATNGLVDDWIDEAEERVWFLAEILKK